MFGIIRNGRNTLEKRFERSEKKLCPCNRKCPCHNPSPVKAGHMIMAIFFIFVALTLLFLAGYIASPRHQTIDVRGETCEIRFKQTDTTSTGAPIGHDEVICPSWSKQ